MTHVSINIHIDPTTKIVPGKQEGHNWLSIGGEDSAGDVTFYLGDDSMLLDSTERLIDSLTALRRRVLRTTPTDLHRGMSSSAPVSRGDE
jgi:hypothetical protein